MPAFWYGKAFNILFPQFTGSTLMTFMTIMYISTFVGEPIMNMNIVKVRSSLADALNRVAYGGERIVLERRGKGVAALVSMEDLSLLQELEDLADIKAARKALKEKGGVPLEQIKKRLRMK
jgi:prevent-host-death family protein